MKRLRISHTTEYFYRSMVTFGTHRALLRPREGHDVHIESSRLEIEPAADVRWLRDIHGNSITMITFKAPGNRLRLFSEVVVQHYDHNPVDFLIDPTAFHFPFQYAADEQTDLIPYQMCSYPADTAELDLWLDVIYRPGQLIPTFDLLSLLNTRIHNSFRYAPREKPGLQSPARTLALGSGSCRDYAVLLMEAARHWGFGARFVTGYVQLSEGQHGSTHAWTEIYIPGAGWRGFDPTNNKLAGTDHVSVAVARDPEKASPLAGKWKGLPNAFDRMVVNVEVVET